MKYDRDNRHCFTFSCSGRTFNPNLGVVGITPDDFTVVYGGFDQAELYAPEVGMDPKFDAPLTQEERRELAAYMSDLWAKFGALPE